MCVQLFPGSLPDGMEFSWIQSVPAIQQLEHWFHGDFSTSLGPTSAFCEKFRCFSFVQPRNVEPRGHPLGTKEGLCPWPSWLVEISCHPLCLICDMFDAHAHQGGWFPLNGWHLTSTSFMLLFPAAKLHLPLANSGYLLLRNYKNALPRQHMPTSSRSKTIPNMAEATTQHISGISAARCLTPNITHCLYAMPAMPEVAAPHPRTTQRRQKPPVQRLTMAISDTPNSFGCNRMAHLNDALDTWWIWMEPLARTEFEQETHNWIFIGGKCKHTYFHHVYPLWPLMLIDDRSS